MSSGYTMVEIMVVLAVSSFLILVSATFLSGSRGRTEFSQSMRDLQSQIQSWIDDVPNGFAYQTNANAYCHLGGGSVVIDNGGKPQSAKPDCIFLGKAIQFTDAPSTAVYAYSVFGLRTDSSGNLVPTLQASGPVPAANATGTGTANFTDTYNLKTGTQLKKIVKSSGITSFGVNSHMAGFYLSLNTDASIGQNGNSNLIAYQYPIGNYPNINDNQIVHCIEGVPGVCNFTASGNPDALSDWELCFENNANLETALLTISASSNGFNPQTKLEFQAC